MISLRWFLVALGAVAVIAAAIGLLIPIQVDDHHNCGEPFFLHTGADAQGDAFSAQVSRYYGESPTYYAQDCKDAADMRKMWGLPVGIAGAVLLIGALTVRIGAKPR